MGSFKAWRDMNGRFHRIGGPAIVYNNGRKEWCKHGVLHNLNGPAIVDKLLGSFWYVNGKQYSESEYNELKEKS